MQVALTAIVSFLGALTAFLFGFAIYKRNLKHDSAEDGRNNGVVLTEIGYIKKGIDDIQKKQAEEDKRYVEIVTELSQVHESTKQAHKRIDQLQKQIQ